jgi:hypothetical protein
MHTHIHIHISTHLHTDTLACTHAQLHTHRTHAHADTRVRLWPDSYDAYPQVESKTIPEIALELARLQQLAAAGKLAPHDLGGGSITISNIGQGAAGAPGLPGRMCLSTCA